METIVSAAIRYKIIGDDDFQVITGNSHADCSLNLILIKNSDDHKRDIDREEQGFVTSTGRFVDRKEAKEVAMDSGQINVNYPHSELFSEFIIP